MFALSESQTERKNSFQKIKDQVESIKMILRCGIWLPFFEFRIPFYKSISYTSDAINELDL